MLNAKRISDPVHGTIELTDLEARVINTRVFQRLRNVKQLGLAHLVFPGADYSRFAHSLGVCHVARRILEALSPPSSPCISSDEIQLYRLAALLHDIGHYPYSHAMEEAINNHYAGRLIQPKASGNEIRPSPGENGEENPPKHFMHERVGKEILLKDAELNRVLKDAEIDPAKVYAIFMREQPPPFANLVSSDLDADRIDYLLRTAHHTGLPYGAVDLDYLMSQMRVDKNNRVCITKKALRTADHFLLCRYFDYQQVAFHKTVAALELVIKGVLEDLLREGRIDCSSRWVSGAIASGEWPEFDDAFILQKIRELHRDTDASVCKARTKAILERRPPKLVAEAEFVSQRSDVRRFRHEKQLLKTKKPDWADEFKIDEDLWYIWDSGGMALTKVGSHVPVSAVMEPGMEDRDRYEQAIRVLNEATSDSVPIVEVSRSLMNVLASHALYSLRVYVLFPGEADDTESCREEISRRIKEDLSDFEWT